MIYWLLWRRSLRGASLQVYDTDKTPELYEADRVSQMGPPIRVAEEHRGLTREELAVKYPRPLTLDSDGWGPPIKLGE